MAVWTIMEAAKHVGHQVKIVVYGEDWPPAETTVECLTCGEVLVSFEDLEDMREDMMSSRTIEEQRVICGLCGGKGSVNPPMTCARCYGSGYVFSEENNV